ncbi:MAG TPA: dihydrofolate reductase family protein [Acidothermaceae bacterium]|jgi:dihydrofolate reductase
MRKVIVTDWVTLDGVAQGPNSADEDTSNGFTRGGWHPQYFDDVSMKWTIDNVTGAGGYLLGRRTYESFAAHWPKASKEEQSLAEPLNTRPKYVASRTLTEPLAWQNSTLLSGDVAKAVGALKKEAGDDLVVIGSTELVHTLMEHDLVDELRLMIDPVVVGGGKRLFPDGGVLRPFELVDTQVVATGAMLVTYKVKR